MQRVIPLEPGNYYHIYNRGVNREDVFREERNYAYFLRLYAKHATPVAETFAYCLLRNHFHFLVRIRREHSVSGRAVTHQAASHAFNNLFNAYAKAINKAHGRTGALFQHHFGRIRVTDDRYFAALVRYIHVNPQKHGFVNDFAHWPHSSFEALTGPDAPPALLERATVLERFGGVEGLRQLHVVPADEDALEEVLDEDEA